MFKEIYGNLITLANDGQFDIISHGCNCCSVMGAGIAVEMDFEFGCGNFSMEKMGKSIKKLGNIDYKVFNNTPDGKIKRELTVINSYTQFEPGKNFDKEALIMCLRKINNVFPVHHIGLPLIGCGIAGGNWNEVKEIIKKELKDMSVTIVHFKK